MGYGLESSVEVLSKFDDERVSGTCHRVRILKAFM